MKENEVFLWTEQVVIPTYEIGEAEKNPVFLDKRVYQGSSGKVYPYPVVETISDIKTDKEYLAIYLENEYLKVMVLPELGGRIQRAYDKTNNYDFVYYNHVIKPALVGLTGPWISGGIEFNWPQHHRPTTFLPVDYEISEQKDGSKSILLHDVDQMYGTKEITKITLYPGKAYIEITGQLYNRTAMPQTFLWWANPAVPANENTQSVFPPDVHAVMDHGKRDVSRFPVATGTYYKMDYSEGVDISCYKNIPVPTSYMAEHSNYDFVGGYDHERKAGILHVADHHISPGKKQWTWGCGDFGRVWERNLTDEDGAYIELMTGVYTDNQPDFSWLQPFEEKTFTQYFMPYKALGLVKNATKEAAVNLEYDGTELVIMVYATELYEHAKIVLTYGEEELLSEEARISPVEIYQKTILRPGIVKELLKITVAAEGLCLVEYQPEQDTEFHLPEPAKEAAEPEKIMTNEELYLTGLHIEQYRHASWQPDGYYLEGLKRDPGDIRINNAYGSLLFRRGQFETAEHYFRKALERLTERNPNPYHSETYYLLGLTLFYQDRKEEAYEAFYKAAWSNEQQEMSYYYLAAIEAQKKQYEKALVHIEKALVKNLHNIKARGLKAYLLRKLGHLETAVSFIKESLELDPFDFISGNEAVLIISEDQEEKAFEQKMRNFQEHYLMCARDYAEFGAYKEAIALLKRCKKKYPMLKYYEAYYCSRLGEDAVCLLETAETYPSDYCFPNKLEDSIVLKYAAEQIPGAKANYYLGCLLYDKLQWEDAVLAWEKSAEIEPEFAAVHRNLSLAYYNKKKDKKRAQTEMETAFALAPEDVRIFLELDQLNKKSGKCAQERLNMFETHINLVEQRDDLYLEYITLLNQTRQYEIAYQKLLKRKFHPWEGGEGKTAAQYTLALLEIAKKAGVNKEYQKAEQLLRQALVYPETLGEGKLAGTKDNHIYYYLGQILENQGRKEEAEECFIKATAGTNEPAGVMYYNDQPADMILYRGLAYKKLGKTAAAKACFYRLIDYGEQHLEDIVRPDYFAVSLPEFQIFDTDHTRRNRAHCYFLIMLGNLGLDRWREAESFLEKALETEPYTMMCEDYEGMVKQREKTVAKK